MHTLITTQLILEPLVVGHAEVLFEVLNDPALYRYLDDSPPPSVEHLRSCYARLAARQSPDGSERWLNWAVLPHGQPPIGYVQATVTARQTAWLAYVFSRQHWGQGYATQATQAVIEHLAVAYAVVRYLATVEAQNHRSIRLLERLGFHAATEQERAGHDLSPTERLFIR